VSVKNNVSVTTKLPDSWDYIRHYNLKLSFGNFHSTKTFNHIQPPLVELKPSTMFNPHWLNWNLQPCSTPIGWTETFNHVQPPLVELVRWRSNACQSYFIPKIPMLFNIGPSMLASSFKSKNHCSKDLCQLFSVRSCRDLC